jgi:hypothetical protein
MPPPFDTVISIGGQSFVDGIWRLLGPALEGLTNPLPLTVPGFTNASMRVTQLVPVFPGTALATGGALNVRATIELTAEALLQVTASAGEVAISLGPQALRLTDLAGTIGLPAQEGSLTDIRIPGSLPTGPVSLGPGTGTLRLPAATAALTGGNLTGTLTLPGELRLPGLPLPTIVPVALDLTPSGPFLLNASLVLGVTTPIGPATRFGLLFNVSEVTVGDIEFNPAALAVGLTSNLQRAVNRIVEQLRIPATIVQRPITEADVAAMLAPVSAAVGGAFDEALTRLLAETGRLIYPPAGAGASCDVIALPTAGDAQLAVAGDGSFVLQVALNRAGTGDIPGFPAFSPMGITDCNLLVGNTFLLELLCCLVERLPAFTLASPAMTSTTDVAGTAHLSCCNFNVATLDLGLVALVGGISVCIDGMAGSTKTFTLIGAFTQATPAIGISVGFTLPIAFDLDDLASLANLRVVGPPTAAVSVTPNGGLVVALGLASFFLVGPAIGAAAIILLFAACGLATSLLTNAINTVLRQASLLRSPVSVPPGIFEAFGRLAPVTVMVDDLTAHGVLHTPTSPWALLPRIGIGKRRPPPNEPPAHPPQQQPPNEPAHPTLPPLTHG